ncbi:MAG: excinuclease subunit [Pseudomonadota bacterium]
MSKTSDPAPGAATHAIRIRGARQNNLKNLDLDIPTNQLVVVTGVSGSGKSSLVFDTLYAEGQRRYVETFSAYARQFLDRMDKPQVDRIEGVPPAIAIDQTNPVRTSRSTVGTMTELNDHLKLLFARVATLHCRRCAAPVQRDTTASIVEQVMVRARSCADPRLAVCFPVTVPANFTRAEVERHLSAQGFTRILDAKGAVRELSDDSTELLGASRAHDPGVLIVVQDRFRAGSAEPSRIAEAVEAALRHGQGRMAVHRLDTPDDSDAAATPHPPWRFSAGLHCADCDLAYSEPLPSLFSFNSPMGACDTCRGFGRVIGIDHGLVIPDESKSLAEGAVKPWQTESFKECQRDLIKFAARDGIPTDMPYRKLSASQQRWVIAGQHDWTGNWQKQWYGVDHFFEWLESKSYKMHIRVLLSKYRAYTACTVCRGARLKPDALLWRLGTAESASMALGHYQRFKPAGNDWSAQTLERLTGLSIHDLMLLPISRVQRFFDEMAHSLGPTHSARNEAMAMLLVEIRARLAYLCDVGLGYLTLDRQSRTLSGGEVQRINLTTALGTSLVNTLFVLDEPSIGLHPRDMDRVTGVMLRLRDAGNSLVVVEHDPQVMFAADRILDIGPGPGERGGQIVYWGDAEGIRKANTLTGDYLSGRRQIDTGHAMPVHASTPRLVLEGAREHNLKSVNVEIPLERFVCITGVSGSGKSTLMQNVLLPALMKAKGKPTEAPGVFDRLLGDDWLTDVVFVDQSPIGKTARSNPVSYVGAFDAIRKRLASVPLARERHYTPGTFSFNSGDGRCGTCGGNGFEHVEMQFLSDVYLRCPDCNGSRFRPETLEVRMEGAAAARRADGSLFGDASVADILDMTVSEALAFFTDDREVRQRLQPLSDVGLDYLRLGQPVPTLSGGEAQRLKLAGFLAEAAGQGLAQPASAGWHTARAGRRGTLFMFDEPTTGLHFDDVARLLRALRKLLAAGHSLLVIEHNLDVVRASDWVIDLGPEGGDGGGEVVAVGSPPDLMHAPRSATGKALAGYLSQLGEESAGLNTATPALRSDTDARGTPGALTTNGSSTGSAHLIAAEPRPERSLQSVLRDRSRQAILVHKAREHNLKNIDVQIPRDQLTVITGVSGSGKSTLAFDVIFGEGQRRYLESLNAYARQFVQPASRPDVDGIFGIPPTVAIEQRTSRGGRKSTVATLTEIYHFLRLLYVKLGTQHCPDCRVAIEPQSLEVILARIMRDYRGQHIGLLAPLIVSRKGVYTDLAKWAKARGHTHLRVDGRFLPTDRFPRIDRFVEHDIELPVASLRVDPSNEGQLRSALTQALDLGKGRVMVIAPLDELALATRVGDADRFVAASDALKGKLFSSRRACPSCGQSFAELDPRLFSFNSKIGWCSGCLGTGVTLPYLPEVDERPGRSGQDLSTESVGSLAEKLADQMATKTGDDDEDSSDLAEGQPCERCEGRRLNTVALAVTLADLSIAQLTAMPVDDCGRWLRQVEFAGRSAEIARDVLAEIRSRLSFLSAVGLGYLALDRAAPTLSGGEAQRIRLAAQLGSNLQGVCYVLDEPTIGLHPRDNRILLDTLQALRDKGNTLLVVEHDEDTIRRADHIIDIGPGAGRLGGQIIASGNHADLMSNPASITGHFLSKPLAHPLIERRSAPDTARAHTWLNLRGAHLHNLRHVDASIPLGRLTVITGVSGSGKSTLARDVLLRNMASLVRARQNKTRAPALIGVESISSWEGITRVLEVDQTPIGKTPRSCPATYVGFWDAIRRLFADSAEARLRGYSPARFSFNTGQGRCPGCEGQGVQTLEMSFLPDVKLLCEVCRGRRFNAETLGVLLRDRSIGDVLAMSVDEALEWFAAHPSIAHPLKLLQDVGLGYLTLGQPSPTLSGGEAQRIKLVTELAKVRLDAPDDDPRVARAKAKAVAAGAAVPAGPHTLYVLDEPTVGLHMADVEKLIRVLHRLVQAGNTLVVVEHNLDIWAEADWIIDLGPDGGAGGGRIVASAAPDTLVSGHSTHTATALAEFMQSRPVP